MTLYKTEVKFRNHINPGMETWISVARTTRETDAKDMLDVWLRSAKDAKNIVGVRTTKDGKEIKL